MPWLVLYCILSNISFSQLQVQFEMAVTDEHLSNATMNRTSPLVFCTGAEPPKIFKITTYTVFMVMSLLGNLLVVAVVSRNKSLRTPVHYLVANMAISDLVIPVIFLPQQIAEAYNDSVWLVHGVLGNFLCKLVRVSLEVSFAVSVLTMATIAVDRFHGILFTFKPPLITRKTCLRIIAVIWVAAAAFRAPSWYGYRLVREGHRHSLRFPVGFCMGIDSGAGHNGLDMDDLHFHFRYRDNCVVFKY